MARAREWTECEFTTLLYRPELSHEALAKILAGVRKERSAGAVGVVREGVHIWHKERRNPGQILSKKVMVPLLADKNRLRTQCWKCKEWF